MVTPVVPTSNGRIFLIGASHMSRTAEFMPSDTVSLAYLGFRPEKEKLIGLKSRLETA
jgi:hypothetical protein